MTLYKFAAFSDGDEGGNPAGVYLVAELPSTQQMQQLAADVGFSETVFAMPEGDRWRVRYFSPETEVPFCGHATIALGAALASEFGNAVYQLALNNADISVEGQRDGDLLHAALQSPPTHSEACDESLSGEILALFGFNDEDLDAALPMARIHAGANHIVVGLKSRARLASMNYSLDAGRKLMRDAELVTILLAVTETPQLFHARNAFASGGVYEDPATGAATAALAGYLRDIQWPHGGMIEVIQGEDMGSRSVLRAQIPAETGSSIRLSGNVRRLS